MAGKPKLSVVQGAAAAALDERMTDLRNARRFVERYGDDLRYCHPWSRWLVWDGSCWLVDETAEPERRFKELLAEFEQEAFALPEGERQAAMRQVWSAERAGRIKGGLELAASEEGIPVRPGELDADPLLFNVRNGTIRLDASALGKHRRNDLITKLAPVEHDPMATAPTWEAFLERVQPDPEMRAFLQRAVGYSLSADTSEQVILICHGAGRNGKTTFIETTAALLGDYGQHAPPETFLERGNRIPNDVARLRGARFVVATETGEGRRLNEALVKQMTGGDTMVARFMRAEYFEFRPAFTPWLITNHRPEIRGTDEAIWRRICLIPWPVTITPEERDPELREKLLRELPGILNWALAGYEDWARNGLEPPQRVRAATSEYRADSDVLGTFLDECCEAGADLLESKGALHAAHQQWAKENGAELLSSKELTTRLKDRGFEEHRTKNARLWKGIRLASEVSGRLEGV